MINLFRFSSKLLCILFFILPCSYVVEAQPAERIVKVIVAPDHANWEYKIGENVKFNISVLQYGIAVKNAKVHYDVMPEKMEVIKQEDLILADGQKIIEGGTMTTPGFLRCKVIATINGKQYTGLATAAFEPLKIQPTTTLPADFKTFWTKAIAEATKIPLDTKMTLLPERCTENVNVYHVNIQNFAAGVRLYGIACIPKKEGKYPAILRVPGAGVRPYSGYIDAAEKGIITFEIGIHGIPVTMDPAVYDNMRAGALSAYMTYGLEDKDRYYYKRVYLGCIRANDFITSLPQYDGKNLAVTGGSQGGALSIVTAALDPRVKFLAANYPALSDMTGYLYNRAGGWPHLFAANNLAVNNKPERVETSKYYDVVNFAKMLKVPGYYSWGYNDETCPPTSTFSAYNVITAPKELNLAFDTGHWTYPEQNERLAEWLYTRLLKQEK